MLYLPLSSYPDPIVPAALFLAALAIETGQRLAVIPDELEDLAREYFAVCPPAAKA